MMIHRPLLVLRRSMRSPILLVNLSLILVTCAPVFAEQDDAPTVAFTRRPGELSITIGGKPFAAYIYRDEATLRPYFRDVHAPDGTQITRNHPPIEGKDRTDHATMHPGLWMAFGDLNGGDFWRNKDRVRQIDFDEAPVGARGVGAFGVRNRYEHGGETIAEEVVHL